jgi:hypothetical protein
LETRASSEQAGALVSPPNDGALDRVRVAAGASERAHTELEAAIRKARDRHTLREIAGAAAMSHEKIRQICGARRYEH